MRYTQIRSPKVGTFAFAIGDLEETPSRFCLYYSNTVLRVQSYVPFSAAFEAVFKRPQKTVSIGWGGGGLLH